MSDLPGDLLYTKEHEWLRREDDASVTIGITDHAQGALDDIPGGSCSQRSFGGLSQTHGQTTPTE